MRRLLKTSLIRSNLARRVASCVLIFLLTAVTPLVPSTTIRAGGFPIHLQETEPSSTAQRGEPDAQVLEAGKSIERGMSGVESHAYRLTLTAGQALHAVVDQRGLDVVVTLFGPDGKRIVQVDSPNGIHGSENVWAIAEVPGEYRLEISSLEKKAKAARYEVRIDEPRAATQLDRDRVAAELAFMEGSELFHAQSDPESLRRAISKYNQSLEIRQALIDTSGQAATLYIIGLVYYSLNDWQQALEHYDNALAVARSIGDRPITAAALNDIGAVYASFENPERSIFYYNEALAIFQELGDPPNEATILSNIGSAYESLGKTREALESLKSALLITRSLDDNPNLPTMLNNIGHIYYSMGNTKLALEYYNEALPLYQQQKDRLREAGTLNNIAQAIGNYEKQGALDYYNRALQVFREVKDDSHEPGVLGNMAMLNEIFGDKRSALNLYLQCIARIESLRASTTIDKIRAGLSDYTGELGAVYKAGLLLTGMRRSVQFFELTETVRARTFLDQLGNIHPDLLKTTNGQLIKERPVLESKLTSLEQRLEREGNGASSPLKREYDAAQLQYEDLLLGIALGNPDYARLRSVETLRLSEVQSHLNRQTTLVSYFVGPDKTFAFVITRSSFRTVVIPVKESSLINAIKSFRDFSDPNLNHPSLLSRRAASSTKTLKRLYAWLIAPVSKYIRTRNVGIIPHRQLHYLPFAALTDGRVYFGDRHTLFYLPSASTLPFIRKQRKPVGSRMLAVAQSRAAGFPFLPHADEECNAVASLYNTEAHTTGKIQKSEFIKLAGRYSIVHIAAHADINMASPLFYRILLAEDDNDIAALQLRQIYDLNLTETSLVVLSACETELGARSSGDDIVALNRAFLGAGAATVIASLWIVDDKSTSELMISFYTHLKGGMSKAEALRAAQSDTRRKYPHPYYWAAFALTGDPE